MSYTNVHIKDDLHQLKEARLKDAELTFWRGVADELQGKLENIPKAVKEWGHVDIYYEGEHLRLVVEPEPDPMPVESPPPRSSVMEKGNAQNRWGTVTSVI